MKQLAQNLMMVLHIHQKIQKSYILLIYSIFLCCDRSLR